MRDFHRPGRSAAYGTRGMAATSAPLATLAAIDTLRAGGNAADAAVVASAVLCVVEPAMTGIGGDCFCLVGTPEGKVTGLNASGRAALAADAEWLRASGLKQIAPRSIHAVTVPGAIDGWDMLLKEHGTMDLSEALKPAIRMAEEGVPVTPRVAADWPDDEPHLAADEGGRMHCLKDGRSPRVGEVMQWPALAATMRTIARGGRDAFYGGEIAEDIVATVRARGSLLTMDDFARHRGNWVKPIATSFMDREILEIPPNGQGLTALIALNILSVIGLKRHAPDSAERHHIEIEAMKLAWELRNRHIADPDFAEVPVEELLSDKTAAKLASLIDMNRALDIEAAMRTSDTIYLSVVDEQRLAVSFINSVYYGFGSCIVTPKTGIALQNRGGLLRHRSEASQLHRSGQAPAPHDHPRHGEEGRLDRHELWRDGRRLPAHGPHDGRGEPLCLRHGPAGGDRLAALFPVGSDGAGRKRRARDREDRPCARGHTLETPKEPLGGGQAIAIDRANGVLIGGSDPRKDGFALGY